MSKKCITLMSTLHCVSLLCGYVICYETKVLSSCSTLKTHQNNRQLIKEIRWNNVHIVNEMRLNNVLRFSLNDIRFKPNLTFVPNHEPILENDIKKLEDFLQTKPNVLVLTGAGISTESGIPGT